MGLENALLTATVAHARLRPRRNAFHYGVYYLCIDLDDLPQLDNLSLISHNKFNIFSFFDRDHGDRQNRPVKEWIRKILDEWTITEADGKIILVTMPRLFGYVFNPVSFWFCMDKANQLRAVLAEVNNTFGDSHNYLVCHDDHRPIHSDDKISAKKIFHVSPFMDISGEYSFRFVLHEDKVGIWINHSDQEGLMLTTSVVGKRLPLTDVKLIKKFFRYPAVTLKVITLIHYQAIKLVLKRIGYRPRPTPPSQSVSR